MKDIAQKYLQPRRPSIAIARRNFRYAGKSKGLSARSLLCNNRYFYGKVDETDIFYCSRGLSYRRRSLMATIEPC